MKNEEFASNNKIQQALVPIYGLRSSSLALNTLIFLTIADGKMGKKRQEIGGWFVL